MPNCIDSFFFISPFRCTLSCQEVAGLGQQGGPPLPWVQQHLQQQGIAGLAPFASLLSAVLLCRCHVLQLYGKDAQSCCVITHLSPHTSAIHCCCLLSACCPRSKQPEGKRWGWCVGLQLCLMQRSCGSCSKFRSCSYASTSG